MNNNGNRPRRSTGKGILDMHPTQLRRGEGTNINPENINILKIKTEDRIAVAEQTKRNDILRKVPERQGTVNLQNTYRSQPRTQTENNVQYANNGQKYAGVANKNHAPGTVKYADVHRTPNPHIYQSHGATVRTQMPTDAYTGTKQSSAVYTASSKTPGSSKKTVAIVLSVVFAVMLITGAVVAALLLHDMGDTDTHGGVTAERNSGIETDMFAVMSGNGYELFE